MAIWGKMARTTIQIIIHNKKGKIPSNMVSMGTSVATLQCAPETTPSYAGP
jgi:hypothetical protein